jgi:serine protease AprX
MVPKASRRTGLRALAALCVAAVTTTGVGASAPHSAALSGSPWAFDATSVTVTAAKSIMDADWLETKYKATGKGVGVALIDTGVAPVAGLTGGNVVNGPDLSFESQDPATRYRDTHGHGTHLAGIIAARPTSSKDMFAGVAKDAKLTSIKVAGANGMVDVSQVIAAVDWTVANRNADPANPIKVLTLAYGTDGVQDHRLDPLAHAVENAWRAGITVVVAGGNDGPAGKLVNPARDPYVLTVGALDVGPTTYLTDNIIAAFSTRGDATRRLDSVAPGRSVVSLRAPGSYIDTTYPGARVETRFFKGSGSSQAAAMVAGTVAQLLQRNPALTPDRVKQLIRANGITMPGSPAAEQDIKQINAVHALNNLAQVAPVAQSFPGSTGLGSLEAARGSQHITDDLGTPLTGESDIFGPLPTSAWAPASTNRTAWSATGSWMGRDYTGTGWYVPAGGLTSWNGRAWSGRAWSGRAWSGRAWSGRAWSGDAWS